MNDLVINKEPINNVTLFDQVRFTISYKGKKGKPFSWLYLDQNTLKGAAHANHLNCEIVSLGEHFDYLARLTP